MSVPFVRRAARTAASTQLLLSGHHYGRRLDPAHPDLGRTDGERVLINSVRGYVKVGNVERDPRVAVALSDPGNSRRYFQVRGRVVDVTTEGGADHIEMLSQKYFGGPYPWFGGRDQVRVLITIEPERVSGMG